MPSHVEHVCTVGRPDTIKDRIGIICVNGRIIGSLQSSYLLSVVSTWWKCALAGCGQWSVGAEHVVLYSWDLFSRGAYFVN